MMYSDARKLMEQVVKSVGIHGAAELLQQTVDAQVELAKSVILPDGYRFFDKGDWMGYSGASRFADGVEPVIGGVWVKQYENVNQDTSLGFGERVDVLVSPNEGESGEPTEEVIVGIQYEDNELMAQVKDRSTAFALLTVLNLATEAQPLTRVQLAALGFKDR